MEIGNVFKAIVFFVVVIFIIGILTIMMSAITNSSAWSIVPNGLTKSLAILLPLILIIGFLIKAISIATKRKDGQ